MSEIKTISKRERLLRALDKIDADRVADEAKLCQLKELLAPLNYETDEESVVALQDEIHKIEKNIKQRDYITNLYNKWIAELEETATDETNS